MKNNCDVSGIMAECKGEKTCMYVKKDQDCIFLSGYGTICTNLAALRAAIEAERKCKEDCACFDGHIMQDCAECVRNDEHRDYYRTEHIVDANKMVARDCENCKHAEAPMEGRPCGGCVVMQNWEPADAGEKVE